MIHRLIHTKLLLKPISTSRKITDLKQRSNKHEGFYRIGSIGAMNNYRTLLVPVRFYTAESELWAFPCSESSSAPVAAFVFSWEGGMNVKTLYVKSGLLMQQSHSTNKTTSNVYCILARPIAILQCVPASRLMVAPRPRVEAAALAEVKVNWFVLDSAERRSDSTMGKTNTTTLMKKMLRTASRNLTGPSRMNALRTCIWHKLAHLSPYSAAWCRRGAFLEFRQKQRSHGPNPAVTLGQLRLWPGCHRLIILSIVRNVFLYQKKISNKTSTCHIYDVIVLTSSDWSASLVLLLFPTLSVSFSFLTW